jgi:hypothetical protein
MSCCGGLRGKTPMVQAYMPGADGFVTLHYDGESKTHCVNGTLYELRSEFYADAKDASKLLEIEGVNDGRSLPLESDQASKTQG